MFIQKFMRTRTIDNFQETPVPPSKKTKEKIIKSNIKNDSKINFELQKMPETDEKPKRKQPEARREKMAQKEMISDSDSDSDLDMNKLMMKKQPKKYLSDSDSD
jgi:hypothetical protein